MSRNGGLYHLMALTAVVVWGTTFVSTKCLLAEGLSPAEIMFYRFLIAYVILKVFSLRGGRPRNRKNELWFAAAGVCGGSLYFLTENTALQITQASNVALLLGTAPLLTMLLSRLFLRRSEPFGRPAIWGSLLALGGMALVIYNGRFILNINPAGDLLTLAAALSWAFYSVILKRLGGRYSTLEITRKVFFYGVLTLLPVFAFAPLRPDLVLHGKPLVLYNLLFLGLVASLLCYLIWNTAVKNLGTVKATNYIYLVPLVTLVSSALILHETITPVALAGAGLLLGGVYIAENGRDAVKVRNLKPTQR